MKNQHKIKVLLLIFIVYAVYVGHRKFFDDIPNKLSEVISVPQETATAVTTVSVQPEADNAEDDSRIVDLKFSSNDEDSIVQRWFSRGLNWILDDPRGKAVFKEAAQRMLEHQGRIIGHDLLASRYLVQDDIVGTGKEASCADVVEISYNIKAEDSKPQEDSTATLILGSGVLAKELENGIIGMKEGGSRTIIYPNLNTSHQASKKGNNLSAKVTLQAVKHEETHKNILGTPLFNRPALKVGMLPLLCGDMVSGSYAITRLDTLSSSGKVAHDSTNNRQEISFKIGGAEYPNELSEAIMGLPLSGAEVFFVTTLNSAKTALTKYKKDLPSGASADYPVLLKFQLQEQK